MEKFLNVLICCEESQEVCKAFRQLGHGAFSNDLKDCSGGHPEWHIKGDAIAALYSRKWDLVIAHPPCTRIANSGFQWLAKRGLYPDLKEGMRFFNAFADYGREGNRICIENPIPHYLAVNGFEGEQGIGKYNQIIQPYQFGHLEKKATCLWLFNLPELKGTRNVYREMMKLDYKERAKIHYCPPGKDRAEIRSKTYSGIAEAMALQYSHYCLKHPEIRHSYQTDLFSSTKAA